MTRLSQLSRSVAGRVALITGAASGMGRATAHLFADEGAKVAICDLSPAALDEVTREIQGAGGEVFAEVVDVADVDQVHAFVAAARDALGPIDIVVNNAGIARGAPIGDEAFPDAWAATLDVNLSAHVHVIRACQADLERNGDGRIINISSTEGLGGTGGNAAYTAAKHGVVGLTKALSVELGKVGVTVNAVCPGPIHTGMTELIPDDMKATFARRRTSLRRYGNPEEVAHITLALALPSASFVTGVAIPVDGGMTSRNQ